MKLLGHQHEQWSRLDGPFERHIRRRRPPIARLIEDMTLAANGLKDQGPLACFRVVWTLGERRPTLGAGIAVALIPTGRERTQSASAPSAGPAGDRLELDARARALLTSVSPLSRHPQRAQLELARVLQLPTWSRRPLERDHLYAAALVCNSGQLCNHLAISNRNRPKWRPTGSASNWPSCEAARDDG